MSSCGGSDSGSDDDGDNNETTIANGTQDEGTPTPGGSLTYAIEADASGGYCLATAQLAAGGIQVANAIYDSLFALDENYEVQPYLAESYSWNPEYTALSIKLREGITFHDGSPLTADVVKLNIDSWRGDAAAKEKTNLNSLLFLFVFMNIAEVTVDDPLTVTIHTKTPWMALPQFLAGGRNGIMAESQMVGGEEHCKENLIGTGPFKVDNWTPNSEMKLSKNPNYWRTDAEGRQLPYLDSLTFKPIVGGTDRVDALEAGSIDAGHFSGQDQFDSITDNDALQLLKEAPGHMEIGYGLVNNAKAPTDDIEIREHLGMAIDREELNEINSGGKFRTADQPFDTDVLGYLEDIETLEYDPDAAEEFFAGKNLSVSIKYATDPTVKLLAESVAAQLKDVGVDSVVEVVDQAALIDQALGGNFNIILWRNHPGLDPDTEYNWWHSDSPVNFGKINDPAIDDALDRGRVSTDPAERSYLTTRDDPEERKTIYEDLNRAFAKGRYNQWNWYTEWAVGASTKVHNITGSTLPDGSATPGVTWGWHSLAETWVDQ